MFFSHGYINIKYEDEHEIARSTLNAGLGSLTYNLVLIWISIMSLNEIFFLPFLHFRSFLSGYHK